MMIVVQVKVTGTTLVMRPKLNNNIVTSRSIS